MKKKTQKNKTKKERERENEEGKIMMGFKYFFLGPIKNFSLQNGEKLKGKNLMANDKNA